MAPSLSKPLQVWHLVVGLAVTILGGFFTAGMAYAGVLSRVQAVEVKAEKLDTVPTDVATMKRDIEWIREKLEK